MINVTGIIGDVSDAFLRETWKISIVMVYENGKQKTALFPSTRIQLSSHCKYVIREVRRPFLQGKYNNLSLPSTNRSFWYLTKNIANKFSCTTFPSIFLFYDTTAASPNGKGTL